MPDVLELEARVRRLERQLQGIPSRFIGDAMPRVFYLICGSGNLLATVGGANYYGLKRPASAVLTVPTVVPSATAGATPDGVSPGTLVTPTGAASTVWIGVRLKPGSIEIDDYAGYLTAGVPFLVRTVVQTPLVTDPTILVPVYHAWRV